MYTSLVRHASDDVRIFVLGFDADVQQILEELALPGIVPVALSDFESGDDALMAARANRSQVEYYFTCTPSLLLYVFDQYPDIDQLIYIDADLFFYSSTAPLLDEIGESPIAVIPHRYSPAWEKYSDRGRFNVAFLTFRKCDEAFACLAWWRERCLEWCYDRCEEGRFGDQGYLDWWPELFPSTQIVDHIGADVAPWNIENYGVELRNSLVTVDGVPLVFYHFEGYRQVSPSLINSRFIVNGRRLSRRAVKLIHIPYIDELIRCREMLAKCNTDDRWNAGSTRSEIDSTEESLALFYSIRSVLEGKYIGRFLGRSWYFDSVLMRSLFKLYDSCCHCRASYE